MFLATKNVLCVVASICVLATQGCTIVGVHKKATVDNTTLVAHTDDAGGGAADIRLVRVPRMDHEPNSKRAVYNFFGGYPRLVTNDRGSHYAPVEDQILSTPLGYIPQVEHTYAYFDQDYGMMNEMQLSIGESTCASRTVGWPSDVSYGYNLFGIAELSKIALERCITARCAIQTMGDLAVEYGFYSEDSGDPNRPGYMDSAETLTVADKDGEMWVFHVLTGPRNASAVWAAQRIPEGHVVAVANAFIIREMNLTDTDNFMASPNVISFAESIGWYNTSTKPFDFTATYGYVLPGPLFPLYAGRRTWRIFDTFAPSLKLDPNLGFQNDIPTYPFSVKPDQPVTLLQVIELLKDHYENTPFDMTKGLASGPFNSPIRYDGPAYGVNGGWERSIAMYRTMFSFVLQSSRNIGNDALDGTVWFSQASPHGSVYLPFSCAQDIIPNSYLVGKQSEFNTKSSWWAFEFVNNWSMLRWNAINAEVRELASKIQKEAVVLRTSVIGDAKANNNATIQQDLINHIENQYNTFADSVLDRWWQFAWSLVGKFSDGYITTGEKPSEMKTPGYSAYWLNVTEFSMWPGEHYRPPKSAAVVTEATIVAELPTDATSNSPSGSRTKIDITATTATVSILAHGSGKSEVVIHSRTSSSASGHSVHKAVRSESIPVENKSNASTTTTPAGTTFLQVFGYFFIGCIVGSGVMYYLEYRRRAGYNPLG